MQQNPVAEKSYSSGIGEEIAGTILQNATELTVQSGEIEVGLAWDFISGMPVLDLDASAVLFSAMGHVVDAAYYNQLSVVEGCVIHSGDQRKGDKTGYDEVFYDDSSSDGSNYSDYNSIKDQIHSKSRS